jgi:actin related protein 2/3 complex subunit 1A/1B
MQWDSLLPETPLLLPVRRDAPPTLYFYRTLIFISQGHDASITVVYPASNVTFSVRTSSLPFVTLSWTNEENLIAAGHDCQPFLFSGSEAQGGWKMVASLDDTALASARSSGGMLTPTATGSSATSGRPGRLNNEAFARFKHADSRGSAALPSPLGGTGSASTDLYTVHQNTITSVRPFTWNPDGSAVESVSTSGVDGRLVIWAVPSGAGVSALANRVGGLHLR